MVLGTLRESMPGERRVALTPEAVRRLVEAGHAVVLQAGAGEGAGYADADYLAAGAEVAWTVPAVARRVELLVQVVLPAPEALALLPAEAVVVGFLHPYLAAEEAWRAVAAGRLSALALERLRVGSRRPVLEPLAAIGGRLAVAMAGYHLTTPGGGPGLLLGGCPGVPPCHVVVLGGGVAGRAAAEEALALGARVTLLDADPDTLEQTGRRPGLATLLSSPAALRRVLPDADVLIAAVGRRGGPAPRLLTRAMVRSMRAGSLIVDLSIDAGGVAETSRPTSPAEPVYTAEGVRHLCIPNLPAEVARTASEAMGLALLPVLERLASDPVAAVAADPGLAEAVVAWEGRIVDAALADRLGLPPEARGDPPG